METFLEISFVPFKLISSFFAFMVAKRFLVVKAGVVRQIIFYAIHVIITGTTLYIGQPEILL